MRITKTWGDVTAIIEEKADLDLAALPELDRSCMETDLPVRLTIKGYYKNGDYTSFHPSVTKAKARSRRYCKGGEWLSDLPPIRAQFDGIKQQYPDVLIFFRLGDFCEAFAADAITIARELGLSLVSLEWSRGALSPMAGVPFRVVQEHIDQLTARGYRVALVAQVGEAEAIY